MKNRLIPCLALLCTTWQMHAQETTQVATANDYLSTNKRTDATILFNTNNEGVKTPVLWGLDTAWPDEWNMLRGTIFIGKDQLGTGRVSFQPSDLIGDDLQLSEDQKKDLDKRLKLISYSGVKDIALNCDHEVLCAYGDDVTEEWKAKAAQHRENYVGKPAEWIKLFKATTNYCREKGFNVVSIAPFNEADYTAWNQGSMANFKEICRLMKEDSYFDGIRVSGGNTLNCDEALKWYNGLSPYLNEGNTHQLAGSFDNYANFFTTVRANGHYATADELHNVMEAMVGVEYGMQTGIWWGFDGRARGEYCRATFGERLAYGEDRAHWTAASVYRMPDGRIQAFGGTSERQANNSSYRIVSQDKVAYFDGYGPMHEYIMDLPGGNGYQNGQTNAERVLEIHTGEDVPLTPIDGTYIIMNKKSSKLLMPRDGTASLGAQLCQGRKVSGKTYQQWSVTPVDSRVGGDFSYFHISNLGASDKLSLNVLNGSLSSGGNIILYNAGDNLEQWYFQYAEDGYYYIISRHSGLCLEVSGGSKDEGIAVIQSTIIDGRDQQLWRLLPTDASCEKSKPDAPTNVKASPTGSTITLTWEPSADEDVVGYAILRATYPDGEWNTIARNVVGTTFVDNTVTQGQTYNYRIRSIDYSQNRSNTRKEEVITTGTTDKQELVAMYSFEETLDDQTSNLMHCVHYGKASYTTGQVDSKSLRLDGYSKYIQLPTAIAHRDEMTISLWMEWNSGSKWQRIFDFGNGEQQYMFLTANADNGMMRLAAKNGGSEQYMDICKPKTEWQHIVITISQDSIIAYINGKKQAESTDITIRTADFKPVFNYIGRSQFSADPLLKAKIDDVRIYNCSLSASNVETLYQGKEVEFESDIDTKVDEISSLATITTRRYYSLDGKSYDSPQQGVNIVRTLYSDGSVTTEKMWVQ